MSIEKKIQTAQNPKFKARIIKNYGGPKLTLKNFSSNINRKLNCIILIKKVPLGRFFSFFKWRSTYGMHFSNSWKPKSFDEVGSLNYCSMLRLDRKKNPDRILRDKDIILITLTENGFLLDVHPIKQAMIN